MDFGGERPVVGPEWWLSSEAERECRRRGGSYASTPGSLSCVSENLRPRNSRAATTIVLLGLILLGAPTIMLASSLANQIAKYTQCFLDRYFR